MSELLKSLNKKLELLKFANNSKYVNINEFAHETGIKKLQLMEMIDKNPENFNVMYIKNEKGLCIFNILIDLSIKYVYIDNFNYDKYYIYENSWLQNTKEKLYELEKLNIFENPLNGLLKDNWRDILKQNNWQYYFI